MCRILILVGFILLGCVGCETELPWKSSYREQLPYHTEKFPRDKIFFVSKTEPRVQKKLKDALRAHGFGVVDKEEACDLVMKVAILSWEYGDSGLSGEGLRDDMILLISCMDRRTKLLVARARVTIHSDFEILTRYVESL